MARSASKTAFCVPRVIVASSSVRTRSRRAVQAVSIAARGPVQTAFYYFDVDSRKHGGIVKVGSAMAKTVPRFVPRPGNM